MADDEFPLEAFLNERIKNLDGSPLLAVAEKWWTPDPKIVAKLPRGGREPNARCNFCGGYHKTGAAHLDFVGHADLTRALIQIDPEWQWEPVAWTEEGLPRIVQRGNNWVLWGRLTLLGKTMLCVGTCEASKTEADKELVGDLLRNGGMRFGIFGALWSKTDGWQDEVEGPTRAAEPLESTSGSHAVPEPTRGPGDSPTQSHNSSVDGKPLPPVAISQPDKPLAAMTMRELLAFATENAVSVSGSKSDIVRTLEPLVRTASGEEPFALDGAEPLPVKEDVTDKPFDPRLYDGPNEGGDIDPPPDPLHAPRPPAVRASIRSGGDA